METFCNRGKQFSIDCATTQFSMYSQSQGVQYPKALWRDPFKVKDHKMLLNKCFHEAFLWPTVETMLLEHSVKVGISVLMFLCIVIMLDSTCSHTWTYFPTLESRQLQSRYSQ